MAARKPKLIDGPALEARLLIEQLQKDLVGTKDEVVDLRKCNNEARAAMRAAQEDAKNTREHFADLKKRLHDSEMECARLNGYMQRVREDDNVADPLVEVEDDSGKRQVSKRFPSNSHTYNTGMAGCETAFATDVYGQRTKREHWTSY